MANKEELLQETEELEEVGSFTEEEEDDEKREGHEPVFEGGPTYDQLDDWKARFDSEIYFSDFDEEVFLWRPLRRKEFRDMNRAKGEKDEYYVEESICRTCVLWPENYSAQSMAFGKAGTPTMLSTVIMDRSGFSRPKTVRMM